MEHVMTVAYKYTCIHAHTNTHTHTHAHTHTHTHTHTHGVLYTVIPLHYAQYIAMVPSYLQSPWRATQLVTHKR